MLRLVDKSISVSEVVSSMYNEVSLRDLVLNTLDSQDIEFYNEKQFSNMVTKIHDINISKVASGFDNSTQLSFGVYTVPFSEYHLMLFGGSGEKILCSMEDMATYVIEYIENFVSDSEDTIIVALHPDDNYELSLWYLGYRILCAVDIDADGNLVKTKTKGIICNLGNYYTDIKIVSNTETFTSRLSDWFNGSYR